MQKMFLLCQTPTEALKQRVKFKACSYLGWNTPSVYLLVVESDINFLANRFLILAQLKLQTVFYEVFVFRLYSNSTILFKYCYYSVQFYCWIWYETPSLNTDISPKYNRYYNLLVSAITVLWKRSFNHAAFVSVNTSLPLFFTILACLLTQNSSETLGHTFTEKLISCSKTIHTHSHFISNPEESFTFHPSGLLCVTSVKVCVSVCIR